MTRPPRLPDSDDQTVTHALDQSPVHEARARGKPFVLEQIEGPGAPRRYLLELDEVVIGRAREANIPVASKSISRQHCALRRRGPEFECVDLGSANGVFLNGVKAHSVVLRDGDTLRVGDAAFVYHEGLA